MRVQELVDLVTDEQIISMMQENGSPVYGTGETSDGKRYYQFQTICHCGNSHKLYYYSDTKTFYCYTNCGAMSIISLIKKIKNFSESNFRDALDYFANKVNYKRITYQKGFNQESPAEFRRVQKMGNVAEDIKENQDSYRVTNDQVIKNYEDEKEILNYFDKNTFYQGWIDEGISEESMKKYGISYYWLKDHIIIPHYNMDGQLVGIRRRSLNPEDSKNKYMPEFVNDKFYDHALALNLYGLYQNKAAIEKQQTAVVVEGEKSVLKSDTYYGDKSVAVATCGFNVSNWQFSALQNLNVNKIFICFDKDFDVMHPELYKEDKELWDGYIRYINKLNQVYKKLSYQGTNLGVYIIRDRLGLLDIKDSPLDKGKEVFEKIKNDCIKYDNKRRSRLLLV